MSRIASSGALVLATFLSACGGGGGSDGGGGCPAGSVLTIFPTSVRVTAGDPAVTFGGYVTNCLEDLRWTLVGPGGLDTNRGVPVNYTPPASVATVTSATLTATVGSLTASAAITIDPASMTLEGKVIATSGAPVEGAVVRVGTASATTDAAGAFSLSGVAPPYDIAAVAPDGLLTSIYPGLRRMDPTLVLFDVDPSFPLSGNASGALTGGAGFPQPAGHEAGVTFQSAAATGSCPVQAGSSTFLLGARWFGPSTVTGELHALQWQVDANGRPSSYDGYGSRTGVTIADHSTVTGQAIALAAVGASSLSGTILNSPSNSASISLFAVVGNGARIRILPPPSDASPFPSLGFQSTFSVPTPAVPGATIDLVARQDYSGLGVYQEVHRHGLAPGATGVAVEFGGLPIQNTPVGGATVGPGTTFTWYSMPDHPVYVVSFRGTGGNPGYDVFTTAQSLTIPSGLAIPPGASYTWRVRGSSAFSAVEDAAGPGGFFAPAPAYRIAQSDTWPFTTAAP